MHKSQATVTTNRKTATFVRISYNSVMIVCWNQWGWLAAELSCTQIDQKTNLVPPQIGLDTSARKFFKERFPWVRLEDLLTTLLWISSAALCYWGDYFQGQKKKRKKMTQESSFLRSKLRLRLVWKGHGQRLKWCCRKFLEVENLCSFASFSPAALKDARRKKQVPSTSLEFLPSHIYLGQLTEEKDLAFCGTQCFPGS